MGNFHDISGKLKTRPLKLTWGGGPDIGAGVGWAFEIKGTDTKLAVVVNEFYETVKTRLLKKPVFTVDHNNIIDLALITANELCGDAAMCMVDDSSVDRNKFEILCAEKLAEPGRHQAAVRRWEESGSESDSERRRLANQDLIDRLIRESEKTMRNNGN